MHKMNLAAENSCLRHLGHPAGSWRDQLSFKYEL
jgi:hypothetical protein